MALMRTLLLLILLPSPLWATTSIVKARVVSQTVTDTTYSITFCSKEASQQDSLKRFTVQGNLKNLPLQLVDDNKCVTTTDEFPRVVGWRTVCYRYMSGRKIEILKLFLNPVDPTFTSAFDSREEISAHELTPFANDTGAESRICENFSS